MTSKNTIVQVMEIERFAIHDGPGIRSVVFLQGCPLRCPWCANPESWHVGEQLMFSAKKCVGCGACFAVAPAGSVDFKPGEKPVFHRKKGVSFEPCVQSCPSDALCLSGKAMTVQQVLDVVLRDKAYYRNSSGGLTISGGEPFAQWEGFFALIQSAKQAGLHVAVETSGQADLAYFRQAEPFVDLFLMDMKHADAEKLSEVTKAKPELIFANLEWLAHTSPKKIVLRVPVIPKFNHDKKSMKTIFKKACGLGITKINLLPYHTLGTDKYAQLGLEYTWVADKILQDKDLSEWQELGAQMGLIVRTCIQ